MISNKEMPTSDQTTYKREYMNNYNKVRRDDYYILMKKLNNRLSYLRKHHGLTDENPEYQTWRLLYPELATLKSTLENINIIIEHNEAYSNIKEKLHAIIDENMV